MAFGWRLAVPFKEASGMVTNGFKETSTLGTRFVATTLQ